MRRNCCRSSSSARLQAAEYSFGSGQRFLKAHFSDLSSWSVVSKEEKVENVTNVTRSFFLSWCARVEVPTWRTRKANHSHLLQCFCFLCLSRSLGRSVHSVAPGGVGVNNEGISPRLLQPLVEQLSLLRAVGGRGAAPAPSPKFSCTTEGRRRLTFRHLPSSTRGFRLGPNWANCS